MKAMAELKSILSGDEDGKMGIGRMIQKIFTTSIIFLLLFPISPFTSHEASGVPGTNHSGNSTGVETWTIEDAPHYIIGDFTILDGHTLTIEPGVNVFFSSGTSLIVSGTLIAEGKSGEEIIFTSVLAEGGVGIPSAGDWDCIQFNPTADDLNSVFEHCVINYANTGLKLITSSPNIFSNTIINCIDGAYLYASNAIFKYNNISNNEDHGFNIEDSSPRIQINNISSNDYGILVNGVSSPEILNNYISSNVYKGIFLYMCSDSSVIDNEFAYNDVAIRIEDCEYALVEKNLIKSSTSGGIEIVNSYSDVCKNTIYNSGIGIAISENSNPLIENNDIMHNNDKGIIVTSSSTPIITGNFIDLNEYGIECQGTDPVIKENKISNSNEYDLYITNGAEPYLFSTIFTTKNIDMKDIIAYDMTYSNTDLVDGDSVTVSIIVKNVGDIALTDVQVGFYNAVEDVNSFPPQTYTQFGTYKYVSLLPGASTQLSETTTVNGGMNFMKAVVDVSDNEYESDENNEVVGEELPVASIVKTSWTVTSNEEYENVIIRADGLNIVSGTVKLHAGMLLIDPGAANGDNGITVGSDGTLILENGNIIRSTKSETYYYFDVHGKIQTSGHCEIADTYQGVHLFSDTDLDSSITSTTIRNGLNSGIYLDNLIDENAQITIADNFFTNNNVGITFEDATAQITNNTITYNDYGLVSSGESNAILIEGTIWGNTNFAIDGDADAVIDLLDVEFIPDEVAIDEGGIVNVNRYLYIEVYDDTLNIKLHNEDVTVTQDGITIYEGNTGTTGFCTFVSIRKFIITSVGKTLSSYAIITNPGTSPYEGYMAYIDGWEILAGDSVPDAPKFYAGTILIGRDISGKYGVHITSNGKEWWKGVPNKVVTLYVDLIWEEEGPGKEIWIFHVEIWVLSSKTTGLFPSRNPWDVGKDGNELFKYEVANNIDGSPAIKGLHVEENSRGGDDGGSYRLQFTLPTHAVQWFTVVFKGRWEKGNWECNNKQYDEENEDEAATAYHFYDINRDFVNPYNVGELYYDPVPHPKAKSVYPSLMSAHLFVSPSPPYPMIAEISTDEQWGNYLGIIYKRNRETGEWEEILVMSSSGQNVPILLPVSVIGQDHPFFWKWVIHWPYNEWKCHFSLGIPPLKASADAYIFSDDGGKIIRGSS